MALGTFTSGSLAIPYMPMAVQALACPPPVLEKDFENCRIPGGLDLWSSGGFYSPGQCFVGYKAECTQTEAPRDGWPIRDGETVVKCIPADFGCNEKDGSPRFATTEYDGTTLSAPAFEIRWRSEDLLSGTQVIPAPGVITTPLWTSSGVEATTFSQTAAITSSPLEPSGDVAPILTSNSRDATPDSKPSQNSTSKSTLTSGSIAGIAVGASLGVLGGILTVLYLAIRWRRQPVRGFVRSDQGSYSHFDSPSSPGPAVVAGQPPRELDPEPMGPRELDASAVSPKSRSYVVRSDASHVSLNIAPIEMDGGPVQRSAREE